MNFLNFGKKKKEKNDLSDSDSNISTPEKLNSPKKHSGSILSQVKRHNSSLGVSEIDERKKSLTSLSPLSEASPRYQKRKIFGGSLSDEFNDEAIPPIIEKLMLYIELRCKYYLILF